MAQQPVARFLAKGLQPPSDTVETASFLALHTVVRRRGGGIGWGFGRGGARQRRAQDDGGGGHGSQSGNGLDELDFVLPIVIGLEQGLAQLGMQRIENAHAGQESQVGGRQVGQQDGDELVADGHALALQACDAAPFRLATGQHRQRQLQAQWPAFGHFVQARGRVAVELHTEAAAHQFERHRRSEEPDRGPNAGIGRHDHALDADLLGHSRGMQRCAAAEGG